MARGGVPGPFPGHSWPFPGPFRGHSGAICASVLEDETARLAADRSINEAARAGSGAKFRVLGASFQGLAANFRGPSANFRGFAAGRARSGDTLHTGAFDVLPPRAERMHPSDPDAPTSTAHAHARTERAPCRRRRLHEPSPRLSASIARFSVPREASTLSGGAGDEPCRPAKEPVCAKKNPSFPARNHHGNPPGTQTTQILHCLAGKMISACGHIALPRCMTRFRGGTGSANCTALLP